MKHRTKYMIIGLILMSPLMAFMGYFLYTLFEKMSKDQISVMILVSLVAVSSFFGMRALEIAENRRHK